MKYVIIWYHSTSPLACAAILRMHGCMGVNQILVDRSKQVCALSRPMCSLGGGPSVSWIARTSTLRHASQLTGNHGTADQRWYWTRLLNKIMMLIIHYVRLWCNQIKCKVYHHFENALILRMHGCMDVSQTVVNRNTQMRGPSFWKCMDRNKRGKCSRLWGTVLPWVLWPSIWRPLIGWDGPLVWPHSLIKWNALIIHFIHFDRLLLVLDTSPINHVNTPTHTWPLEFFVVHHPHACVFIHHAGRSVCRCP